MTAVSIYDTDPMVATNKETKQWKNEVETRILSKSLYDFLKPIWE